MATPSSSELLSAPESTNERRETGRILCKLEIAYAEPGRPSAAAMLRDVSPGGIGLGVNEPIARGALVSVQLRSEAEGIVFTRMLRVKYANPETAGTWAVGGSFDRPLTKKEMKRLLQDAGD